MENTIRNPDVIKVSTINHETDLLKHAQERAPATLFGIFAGGVLGALIDGPRGALIGSALGGATGFMIDTNDNQTPEEYSSN